MKTKVQINEFMESYLADMPEALFQKMNEAEIMGKKFFKVSDKDYKMTLANYEKRTSLERSITEAANNNNLGIEAEKSGDIELAVSLYEKNLSQDSFLTSHPYHRLVIIYRKMHDVSNEERVCRLALERLKSDTDQHFFSSRLSRIQAK